MPVREISNTLVVEIGGRRLPGDVYVSSVVVDDDLHRPGAFTIVVRDPARTALSKAGVRIGADVRISVLSGEGVAPVELIEGEVTALEAEITAGVSTSVIRGYDRSHRLFRGRVTAVYRQMSYDAIVRKVASRAGLRAEEIEATRPTHEHVSQTNETDASFLGRLAREVGFELTVERGAVRFAAPRPSRRAPARSDLTTDHPLVLNAGAQLRYVRAVVTAAEQVRQVEVRGWDGARKRALVSTAAARTTAVENGHSPARMARAFGDRVFVATGTPYSTAGDVAAAAKAVADEIASSFSEIEGQARGNARLRAGAAVHLGLLGEPFDGSYVLTSTRHTYDADDGYLTGFVVSGRQDRSTLRLAGGGHGPDDRVAGVVPAIVDDVADPRSLCRVRLRFPWMDDRYVSDWCRVAQAGAGSHRGMVVMPEVGDEVLVAFEQGDMRRPYVVGGLYSAEDPPEFGGQGLLDPAKKTIDRRLFTSRKGHRLVFVDADRGSGVTVATGDGKLVITLDQSAGKISVASAGSVEVAAKGDVSVEAGGTLQLKGMTVKIEARTSLAAKGADVSLEAQGPVQVKGQPLRLN